MSALNLPTAPLRPSPVARPDETPASRTCGFALAAALAVGLTMVLSRAASAEGPCEGHALLPAPRDEGGCLAKPLAYPAPDGATTALVFPVDIDLYATPDMESRVAFRGKDAKLLISKSFGSARGANGYYVVKGAWSPDSRFFVFSLSSSGGHSPWSFPTWAFNRETNAIVSVNQIMKGNPTLSPDFSFVGPHTVATTTWVQEGSQTQIPVTVDLGSVAKKPPSPLPDSEPAP